MSISFPTLHLSLDLRHFAEISKKVRRNKIELNHGINISRISKIRINFDFRWISGERYLQI